MPVLFEHLPELWQGLIVTVQLTAASFAGAAVLGVLVCALRVSPVGVLRAIGTAYVETFQNLPLLVLLVLAFFGLPEIGLQAPPLATAIIFIATAMNTALVAAVGVVDLTAAAHRVNLVEARPIPIFVGAGVAYALIASVAGFVTGRLERRLVILR
ncbi:ABC transporter permease subunit [Nonomuraea fuscirosea]|uniref:ABC transporter permease subunit n=1 Tax=Nonomuraea fuscirosea TaxID=1291556 RepID=UPI00341DA662